MSSPEWILAVGRLKLFLYLEESPGLGLVVDPVEAGEGDVFLVPEVGRLKERELSFSQRYPGCQNLICHHDHGDGE